MISIGLKFLPGEMNAPEILLKGEGQLGELIQSIAKLHDVEIIKDPVLTTNLKDLPEGSTIPENLFHAVASIYSILYQIESKL